ncbi:hypothetical protein LMH87_012269 [Akanthomyces muscarius]|uniref:ABC multidrug transporter n=1 Tax=Akanthomyces muscarius TaxID=2231603 RepID=A0A9W8ULM4_AKAMU|nr:hypothetical protein LMH87_012269 [Akanthomyces muscarius]KAJ4151579.1 hypothetical protein LMH87_012269 [Akanthomyces muscarius]
MSTLAADRNFWDPLEGIFDFSLKFEEAVLQLIPSGISLAFFPIFAYRYRHDPIYVRSSPLLWAKLLISAVIVACQAAAVGIHKHATADQTDTAIPAASLELLAAINMVMMVYIGHRHSIRSSGLLATYLLFTFAIDIVKARSYFLRGELDALGGLAATTASLRFLLLILEERSKRNLLFDQNLREISGSEATSGYFTRSFFLFLNPIFLGGFSGQLQNADLEKLGLDFSSKVLHEKLQHQWERDNIASSDRRLFWATFYAFRWDLFLIFIPRLLSIGASFAQPFLIELVTETAELDAKQEGHKVSNGKRGGMSFSTVLVYVALAVTKVSASHLANRLAVKVRGAHVAKLMDKTHKLSEREAKKSAVLTHMSSDIEDIAKGLTNFIDIPMVILEVVVGVFFLSRFIGASCFFVLLPVLGTNMTSFLLSRKSGPALGKWNKRIEMRIAKTTEVLRQLPAIKMLGLGPTMRDQLHRLRVEEMEVSKIYRTPIVVIAGAFFWRGFEHRLVSSRVFPTLGVVSLIQTPTIKALMSYTDVTAMLACFGRIQGFMDLPEREDSRVQWDPSAPSGSYELVPTSYGSDVMRSRVQAQSPYGIIQFANASIGPVDMDEPLLKEINLSLLRGAVSGVLGPTGSGKSTFLKSILGETKNAAGYVYTDKVNIAYCGANVWLKDASIRDNIVGCLEFDAVLYQETIQACQLEEDIGRLPGGHDYVVGPNGFNLSGGQRQRVSLARAAFARCDITVIDDGFSSLDRRTATSILFALCGADGLLRRTDSTVLISTYLPEVVDIIDHLITVDEDGHIVMEGPHENPARSLMIAGYLSSVRPCISEDIEDQEKASIRRLWVLDPAQAADPEEVYRRQRGSWQLYLVYIDSIGRFKCLGLAILAFLVAGSEYLPEVYMRVWTERHPESGKWFIGYACLAIITFVLSAIAYWLLFGIVAVKAAIALHEQMLNATMGATLGFLTSTKTGNILNRFSQDTTLFAKVLPSYLFRTMYMFFSSVVLVAIILSSASFMSVSLPAIVVAIYFIQGFYLRTSRQIRHIDLEEKAPLYTYFCETAEGILYIQAFGWRSKSMANGYRLLDNSQQPYYLMQCIQQWLVLVLGLLTAVIAFILVSIVVWGEKGTSGPAVGLSFLSVISFQRILVLLLEAWTGSETSVAAISRLEQFKKETPQEHIPEEPEDLPADWAPEGYIDFTNVSARYKPARDTPPIIRDFSLAVEAGDKVGLVGRTGSGKSSLLLALLGFLHCEGRVEIDGIDVKNIDPDFLRSRVISITQDSVQLNETVRKNLLPFTINDNDDNRTEEKMREQQLTDSALVEVLQSLNLWSQIVQKGGLDAMLVDSGYSKGELQLFSIARALVRRRETGSGLVLIDEATSNLDALRDQETQAVMREEFNDCTVLTIAHREETIRRVDFTVALDDGEMTSMGVPQVEADRIAAASQD